MTESPLEENIRYQNTLEKLVKKRTKELQYKITTLEMSHSAIENLIDAICFTDANDKITFVNGSFLKMYGYEKEELIGQHINIVRPQTPKKIFAGKINGIIPKTMIDGGWEGEIKNVKKDGTEFSIYLSTAPINNASGKIIGSVGVAKDITERKKTEDSLRERVKELNGLFGLSNLIEKVSTLDELIIRFAKEIVSPSMNFSDEVHIGFQLDGKEYISCHEHKPGNIPYNFIAPILVDGVQRGKLTVCYLKELPLLEEEQKLVFAFAKRFGKVIEKKEADEALKESEEKYRSLVEKIEEGLGIVDENENYTYANPALCKLLGYSAEELIEMNLKDLIPKEEYKKILEQTNFRKKRDSSKYETIMIGKDGKYKDVSVTASSIFGDNGEYKGAQAIIMDITEQKERFNAMQNELDEIKGLDGLIPICAGCKKIRDEDKESHPWVNPEQYIMERLPNVNFSHGMCPDCLEKFYPEFYEKRK
ncbi:MAG: PAS domain S-box protein [Nanoarchaeota archaeon]|nr:PAS domain S-box protein [Nanoarchaeota archaeon]MBU1031042.1 PAS domain S-box protein [Nanoarchaeota archaeon]